jgi:hypothetical protein
MVAHADACSRHGHIERIGRTRQTGNEGGESEHRDPAAKPYVCL